MPKPRGDFLLEMRGIVKGFPGVAALAGVGLEVGRGEVVALVGENGAGKSTLMGVLGGILAPDQGEILWDGAPIALKGVREAQRLGIAHMHQELMVVPNLDVAANIHLGREHRHPITKILDRRGMAAAARRHLARIGVTNIDPGALASRLTTGQMQMVEIAKALSLNARLVVMDEPTSSLTLKEAGRLHEVIHELKRQGVAVIYISHRLNEIFAISDRVIVLRDGRRVAAFSTAETNHEEVVRAMVGRTLCESYPERNHARGAALFDVEGLGTEGAGGPNSFCLHHGEILGFAGLVGAGRTELMRALFGVSPINAGAITLEGRAYAPSSPREAISKGVYLVPEDRKLHGLILDMSVQHNLTLPSIKDFSPWKKIMPRKEREAARFEVDRMRIRTPSLLEQARNLSGGNQQKLAIGKWLARTPKALILDEPTRGIDVGARGEIYQHMAQLAAGGLGIILVSSDMEEVLGMSDRVAVMHEGRIAGILEDKAQITEENIMRLATGGSLIK